MIFDLPDGPRRLADTLISVAAHVEAELEEALAEHRLTRPSFLVLDALDRAEDATLTQRELVDCVRRTAGTLSVRLGRLERARLIVREPEPENRRTVSVTLTERGEALVAAARPAYEERARRLAEGVPTAPESLEGGVPTAPGSLEGVRGDPAPPSGGAAADAAGGAGAAAGGAAVAAGGAGVAAGGAELAAGGAAALTHQLEGWLGFFEPGEDEAPRLGVAVATAAVARRMRRAVGLADEPGVLVMRVGRGSAAEGAGLSRGDLIIGAGEAPVRSVGDLERAVRRAEGTLRLSVLRGAEPREVEVRL